MTYYKQYTGNSESIFDALTAVGVNGSYANRAMIASANGITPYSGTAEQNKQMLALLKAGKLISADGASAEEILNANINATAAADDKKKKIVKWCVIGAGAGLLGFLIYKIAK